MTQGSRNQNSKLPGGNPAHQECLLQSIERITPQNSFNHAFPVERGTHLSRRGFLKWGTLSFSLLSFLGISRMVQAFLSMGRKEDAPSRFSVGRSEDFPMGGVAKIQGVYLVRDENGLFALKGDCPHLGCSFRWNEAIRLFECPCHGSRFELSGRFVSGPAKKPLQHVLLTKNQKNEIIADILKPVPEDFRI